MIKICGITTEAEVSFLKKMEVDFVGFIFAPSKRRVTPAQAKNLGSSLAPWQKKVGVFVNTPIDQVNVIAKEAGLDYIQLHGQESPEDISKAALPVIKAIGIKNIADFREIERFRDAAFVLIDHQSDTSFGGTGERFDWTTLHEIPLERQSTTFIAGGITPTNVIRLAESPFVYHIDVSSGVEGKEGKEASLVEQLIVNWKKKGEDQR